MHHLETKLWGNVIHLDTLLFTWACMLLILLSSIFLVSGLKKELAQFGKRQFCAEMIYNFVHSLAKGQIGARVDNYVFFIGSIFIFILVNYYAGLMPWKLGAMYQWWPMIHGHPWHGASPCADINIPAGIAVLVIAVYLFTGVFIAGFRYVQTFLPVNFTERGIKLNLMCLIEIMDLAVRPLTLSLRLFANTVAGETLLATFISLVAILLPVAILGFEMAVGLLQAFIFTILATVYIGAAVQHAEHLLHDEHH